MPGSPYDRKRQLCSRRVERKKNKRTYDLAFDRTPVDGEVSEVGQKFLCTVLALNELEEVWRIINELKEHIRV